MAVNLETVRELVQHRKDGLPVDVADLPEDWRYVYKERAAIREYDGGQCREQAQQEALAETVRRMEAASNK